MVNKPYEQAQNTGLYEKPASLKGKYDNVCRFWEDQITCYFLQPYLAGIRQKAEREGRGVRVMDLGCGSGDGYELLTAATNRHHNLASDDNHLLPDSLIEKYVCVDINEGLLKQGKAVFAKNNRVSFRKGSFDQGLPVEDNEEPLIYI